MPERVSPGCTVRSPSPEPADGDGAEGAGRDSAGAAADGAGAGVDRAMAPSLAPAPVDGGATGAACWSPGANTGGSRSSVYSRTERLRIEFTSTRSVRNGSVTDCDERIRMIERPSDFVS